MTAKEHGRARLTKAQTAMLHTLSDGRAWDRRGVFSKTQWNVIIRLSEIGLVSRSMFHATITAAGKAALDAELLRDANSWYSEGQLTEMRGTQPLGESSQ